MSWESVKLVSGANVEATPTLNQAGYLRTAYGRFKGGLFQKLGGWIKYADFVFPGRIKSLWAWLDLNNVKRLSVASTTAVTIVTDGMPQVITPQTLITNPTPNFSTVAGSNIVTIIDPSTNGLTTNDVVEFLTPVVVDDIVLSGSYPIASIVGVSTYTILADHNATATVNNGGAVPTFTTTVGSAAVAVNIANHAQVRGNTVVFPIPTTVGGVTIQGKYTVTRVVTPNQFTITASNAATTAATVAMNGGNVRFRYYIALGPVSSGVGFGVGAYGTGAYGLGTSSTGVQVGVPITADDWTQDNWGEILMACPLNGGIYTWQPNTGFQNLAIIPTAPLFNTGMFISMAQQQVMAYGSSIDARIGGGIGIYQDPMLVQWCTIGDFNEWFPSEANFARNYRIPTGSKCVGGAATKNRNLIWTDLDLHAFTFNSGNSVYTPNRVGSNCGLIGQHGWAQQADTVYWMGVGNFFSYAGSGVQPMPCSVWDEVFQRIDPAFQHQTVAASNSDFTEIWFYYPTFDSGGLSNRYAKYNVIEQTWDYGISDRCAWIDRSVLGFPLGAASSGLVYAHEAGFDDDTNPLVPMFETGDFYLDKGEDFVFIDQVYPDFKWGVAGGDETAQILITLLCRDAPGETQREYGPFLCTKAVPFFNPANPDGTRPRARQVAIRVTSTDIGSFWRLGLVRFRVAPDGRR